MKVNYNEQRLIPFIGGLALGGLGSSVINHQNMNYNYYPQPYPYAYSYPIYYQYPVIYQTNPNPQVNIYNPYVNKTSLETQDQSIPLEFEYNEYRNTDYLKQKDVPEMENYFRSDMI